MNINCYFSNIIKAKICERICHCYFFLTPMPLRIQTKFYSTSIYRHTYIYLDKAGFFLLTYLIREQCSGNILVCIYTRIHVFDTRCAAEHMASIRSEVSSMLERLLDKLTALEQYEETLVEVPQVSSADQLPLVIYGPFGIIQFIVIIILYK